MSIKKQNDIRLATDIIAKLLASENLKIIDGGTTVSYIDVVKREVHVIKFKHDSPLNCQEVRLTSLAHEVGHALFTPIDLLHEKIDESYPNLAPFINIVEDVRIERLIKNRFAGLHRTMNEGRKIMYENGVFGEDAVSDPNNLSYINKFILAFKVGIKNTNGLVLKTHEDCILRYIELHATDKESVIKCAKLLYNLCEYSELPKEEQKLSSKKNESNSNSDSSNEDSESNSNSDSSDEDSEIDKDVLLRMLLTISESQSDDDISYKVDYSNNILEEINKKLENHVDKLTFTATMSKNYFSNNIIRTYIN